MNKKDHSAKHPQRLSNFSGALFGLLTMVLVLAAFNSQYLYAQSMLWLQPAAMYDSQQLTQSDSDTVSSDPRLLIPKINIDASVVYDMKLTDDKSVSTALEHGVLHFGNSVYPGERGNAIFVGHSSNDVWAPGDYKFIFALLDHLEIGDTYALHYNGVKYVYEVTEKKVVLPSDLSVLENSQNATSTLITCTPVGTNLKRLVVQGRQIAPSQVRDSNAVPVNSQSSRLPGSS